MLLRRAIGIAVAIIVLHEPMTAQLLVAAALMSLGQCGTHLPDMHHTYRHN
jgi:drug/metabolite transporter (DMT)-like permease